MKGKRLILSAILYVYFQNLRPLVMISHYAYKGENSISANCVISELAGAADNDFYSNAKIRIHY